MAAPDRVVYRAKGKKPKLHRRTWRDYPDALLPRFNTLPSPASLHPDPALLFRYLEGLDDAAFIVEAWRPSNAWQGLIREEVIP